MKRRFRIRFDAIWRGLFGLLFLSPSQSYVDVDDREVEVRMGWAFSSRFPRSAVAHAARHGNRVLSIGVHGIFGRWLVNGSSQGILTLTLDPPQRARVLGVPVGLKELMVSVDDPEELRVALSR